ncbi:MAG: hypothetical protein ACI9IT_000645 [Glaciecola sp.]|jgi:hypothetical protein
MNLRYSYSLITTSRGNANHSKPNIELVYFLVIFYDF